MSNNTHTTHYLITLLADAGVRDFFYEINLLRQETFIEAWLGDETFDEIIPRVSPNRGRKHSNIFLPLTV